MTAIISTIEELQQKVWSSDMPVMLTFGLDWSGKCVIYNWMVDAVSKEFDQVCQFYKVEADQARQLVEYYKINIFPTSLLLYKGEVMSISSGIVSKANLKSRLDSFIGQIKDSVDFEGDNTFIN